ncbi:hypothetical protein G7084_05245 [Weissella coleopterorum]|uniref:Uncharacterized protein n=1 Tax=Weissella coleopterorum TaxID=2714949 RepID=A0A6G8B0D0_9LACO|nr:hypothetical protein [Weissella coleopterorum]QIL50768.1 hypothetical protein G7084_05245 [Weissella coleopterorum]
MAKLKNFSKVNPVNQAKLFLISSLATVMVTVNFNLFQPVVANAAITEQTATVSDGIENLTQVRLAGPFNELNNSLDASQQKMQVKGNYQAGDLVQVMLNGTAFIGVVPNDAKVGLQIALPIVVQQSRLNVAIEGTLYQGNIISD